MLEKLGIFIYIYHLLYMVQKIKKDGEMVHMSKNHLDENLHLDHQYQHQQGKKEKKNLKETNATTIGLVNHQKNVIKVFAEAQVESTVVNHLLVGNHHRTCPLPEH